MLPSDDKPKRYYTGVFCCVAACVLWSLSGLYSRLVHVDIPTAITVRNSVCGVVFALLYFFDRRKSTISFGRVLYTTLFASMLGAISSMGYIGALLLAPVANVVIIYATTPIFAAFIAWMTLGTRTDRTTLLAILFGLVGVVIVFGDGIGNRNAVIGNTTALVMTAATAGVMIVMQRRPAVNSLLVTCLICLISVLLALPFSKFNDLSFRDISLLGIYGLSGGGAFIFLTRGVRELTPVEAGLISTLEVVLAPLWVYFAFGDIPSARVILGGIVVLIAICGHLYRSRPEIDVSV